MLKFGDGGGADSRSGGGDDSSYNSGGGYTVHQLQLEAATAAELNALLVETTAHVRRLDPLGINVSNRGGLLNIR